MAGDAGRRGHKVVFEPDGKSVRVEKGATVLDACRAAGIQIDAVCGGEGKCGRCRVKIKGPHSEVPSALLSAEEIRAGVSLACLTKVLGSISVEVLPRSRLGKHQILTKSVEGIPKPLSPWVMKEYIELSPASLSDNTADLERLLRSLKGQRLSVPLEVLKSIPTALRQGDWKITVTVSDLGCQKELMAVEQGDSRRRLLGVAIDIGTTTIVVELVDLLTGEVLGTASDYNRQISRGEDVIARMMYSEEKGLDELTLLARETINSCIGIALKQASHKIGAEIGSHHITAASVAGNTVMTHFFAGLPTQHVRLEPYIPVVHTFPEPTAREVGLSMNPAGRVVMFPSRAGYVGGDVVADVLASRMYRAAGPSLLIDVGTNGEIVLGGKDWMITCSCSAGPAFEGAEVSSGMRAMEGAIDRIRVNDDLSTTYHVIGEAAPMGICGSGLIDLVSEMYAHGIIDRKARIQDSANDRIRGSESGNVYVVEQRQRLAKGAPADLVVTEPDLQNLLRTKAAIYGACAVLLRKTGETVDKLSRIYIAGGFGYHLDIERAISIGMFPDVPREKYTFIGNGALGGARLALLSRKRRQEAMDVFGKMTYLELSVDNEFYNEFSSSLFIPHTDLSLFPSAGRLGEGR